MSATEKKKASPKKASTDGKAPAKEAAPAEAPSGAEPTASVEAAEAAEPPPGGYPGGDDADHTDVRTFDQLRKRLALEGQKVIDKDDPLAIHYTMHRVFIDHLEEVHAAERVKLEAIFENTGEATAAYVRECLKVLRDETLDSSLKQTLARVAQEAANATSVQNSFIRLRNTTFIMVALSWVALFLNIIVLVRS